MGFLPPALFKLFSEVLNVLVYVKQKGIAIIKPTTEDMQEDDIVTKCMSVFTHAHVLIGIVQIFTNRQNSATVEFPHVNEVCGCPRACFK